jgi:hypothetical protein
MGRPCKCLEEVCMKDVSFPPLSKEEREEIWNNLKPNDLLISVASSGWSNEQTIVCHRVSKRTPKGSIRLENGVLLTSLGNYFLDNEELRRKIACVKLEKEVMYLLYKANKDDRKFKSNLCYEDALKLKEILEKVLKGEQK